jgi:integrase
VFPSPDGSVLDPDNLIKRYFLPCIEHAGLRRFRFHDLRHTFGSLLIQDNASITYVKDQMGHSVNSGHGRHLWALDTWRECGLGRSP